MTTSKEPDQTLSRRKLTKGGGAGCARLVCTGVHARRNIIIIRSASHTVALVQTKIATYTKKINLKSKSKYTKERFYLNQY